MEYLVLIVDDDPEEQLFFNEALKRLDSRVTTVCFSKGEEAIQWLNSNEHTRLPDFVLLDINMPKMCGFTILQKLKAGQGTKQIPVYMFSTSDWDEDRKKANTLGAQGYFSKPYTIEEYSKLIAAILYENRKNSPVKRF